MSRLRYNNDFGTLGAALTSTGVTITFAVAPNFATIVSPDFIPIVLDASTSTFEVVYLTAYTAAALTGTITRAAEDATHWPAVAHLDGGTWGVNPTTDDYGDSALSAPLQLPATAAGPLTTQGGNTLDDGTGQMVIPAVAANGVGFNIVNSSTGSGFQCTNSSTGSGLTIDNPGSGNGATINNGSWGSGFVVSNMYSGTGLYFNNENSGHGIFINNTGSGAAIAVGVGGPLVWSVPPSGITQSKGNATTAITSGALPTIALVSGTAAQVDVSRDVDLTVPVTFLTIPIATATCVVALSPDNVTYTTTVTESEPKGIASGRIRGIKVHVPAG